ncbi:ATP-binding protein [Dactylosporangium siamense]|uniref:Tetratricopeptide repeat protein n=1 Tax=Dactylosporangium siamense TaxID=685454 RepID=A0A919PM17_9ACTN|nr:tetratricopeptide repeat protein [Dactylosporangium siamense]GIG44603.1 hypothetical protein Dsi01nite_026440 [Dactylosporangium siamense]
MSVAPPDPGAAGTVGELVERLRQLKVWAGDPSFERIKDRVDAAWTAAGRPPGELPGKTTIVDCFRSGRRRLNADLVVTVVAALHPDPGYTAQWRQALQVVGGQALAAAQVRVWDTLPPDLAAFTGRDAELDLLRAAVREGAARPVVITGMAGVGKTRLAVHAAHGLSFDRVLFVDLRGFHPDAGQPPAEPGAVLDGFLRLLGVPGQQVPHDLPARSAAFREHLAGTRTLLILDNAAGADQVRALLPGDGIPVLITSRRRLAVPGATRMTLEVFTAAEALTFLTATAPHVPAGADPGAAARVAHRCGRLPLALGLVAAHIRAKPGWTLTDHADRLDERHERRHLDGGVQVALDLSYRDLPADRQRLLRLVAAQPGQDVDAHAAAALAGTDPVAAHDRLRELCRDHLLQEAAPGRYTMHDLIRAYAANRSGDDDSPADRRAALTRLFDYYLAAAARAMEVRHPAEAHRRPHVPPPGAALPALDDPATALTWLDIERPGLVAVAGHTAAHGWPGHTVRLAAVLYRYLTGGHLGDALVVHGHARDAARRAGDVAGHALALTNLGVTHLAVGRPGPAADLLREALDLFQDVADPVGQARALTNLGVIDTEFGRYTSAVDGYEQAIALFRRAGDGTGEAHVLGNLGELEARLGRAEAATAHHDRALALFRQAGDDTGEAWVLSILGEAEVRRGDHGPARAHLQQALMLYRQLANRLGEAWVTDSLGALHHHLGRPAEAMEHHRRALEVFRETGDRDGEASALIGLGEAAQALGRPSEAVTFHAAALGISEDPYPRARAHTGLGRAHQVLDDSVRAGHHYRRALRLHTELGTPDALELRAVVETGAPQ